MRSPSAAWLIIGFATGCAQPSIPHPNPGPATTASFAASAAVVTRRELDRAVQRGNLMTALQQVRPWFLTGRGGPVVVSLNGSVFGDTSVLRNVSVTDVCEVRLVRGTSQAGRPVVLPDGSVSSGGDLIEVTLPPCPRQW
jgi:hypothetical protein